MAQHQHIRQRPESRMASGSPLIDVRAATKTYATPSGSFTALKEVSLQVHSGEFVAIVGKSGSGKSTLLNMLSGIDSPTSGEVFAAGTPIHALNQNQIAIWRGNNVGMVFQFFQLLPTLTVLENVMLPMDFCHTFPAHERKDRAMFLLEQVDIAEQANKLPALLSGGQQQRAAIARAQANNPPILLADEPTGNLDSQTAKAMFQLFKELALAGKTIVLVTHEHDVAHWVSRVVTLADGRISNNMLTVDRSNREGSQEVVHA